MASKQAAIRAARAAAQRYGVDPNIFQRQINQESHFQQGLTSKAGARDIAQFIPSTAAQYGVKLGDGRVSDDLDGAARLMRDALKRNGGDYRKALSVYNSGKPDGYKTIAETAAYVKSIMGGSSTKQASSAGSGTRSTTTTTPATTKVDQQGAIIDALLSHRGVRSAVSAIDNGLYTSTTPAKTSTTTTRTRAAAQAARPKNKSPLLELFWQGQGGIDVKNGQKVAQGFVSGHKDHVHVAAGRKTVVAIGKLAQQMGLRVGENPAFNGGKHVSSGHATNSYHYRDQAVDVSGDAKQMAHFAATVAHMYGLKVHG